MNKALFTHVAFLSALPASAVVTNIIQNVSPTSTPQGSAGLLVTFTLNSTPTPPPATAPITSVYLGGTAGTAQVTECQSLINGSLGLAALDPRRKARPCSAEGQNPLSQ